jgi:hypothetical protein
MNSTKFAALQCATALTVHRVPTLELCTHDVSQCEPCGRRSERRGSQEHEHDIDSRHRARKDNDLQRSFTEATLFDRALNAPCRNDHHLTRSAAERTVEGNPQGRLHSTCWPLAGTGRGGVSVHEPEGSSRRSRKYSRRLVWGTLRRPLLSIGWSS